MNKIWLFGAAVCMVLALGSCKPKQSAYKAAYEQAKEKESTAPVEVVEQEVDIKVIAAHIEMILIAKESKAGAKFQ